MRIHDRPSFLARLAAARNATPEILGDTEHAGDITRQLTFMQQCVEAGPDEEDGNAITLGPLSVTALASSPDDYRSTLQELDYAFRRHRWLAEPFRSGIEGVTRRRGILQVRYGRDAFRKQVIEADTRIIVGGDARADLILTDPELAGRHLEVWWDGVVAHVRCLTEAPVTIDGEPRLRGELTHGGTLTAGSSTLRFFVEAFSPARASRVDTARARARLAGWWSQGQLFAVIDAARSARALQLLEEAIDDHASLYEGDGGRGLDGEAPYLVRLSPRSALFDRLLDEGWGSAWGIYLASSSSPKLVRRSLRRLLMVAADTRRDPLYFRFYDPRVLTRFVPLATARQKSELVAEADAIFYEDDAGSLLELTRDAEEAT